MQQSLLKQFRTCLELAVQSERGGRTAKGGEISFEWNKGLSQRHAREKNRPQW